MGLALCRLLPQPIFEVGVISLSVGRRFMADSIANAQNTSKEKGRVSISFLAQLRQERSNLKRENLTHLLPPRGIDATVFGAIGDWRGMEHGTWSIVKDCGGQEANERRQMTEDRRQQAASRT